MGDYYEDDYRNGGGYQNSRSGVRFPEITDKEKKEIAEQAWREAAEIPYSSRKVLHLILCLDTSSSMEGSGLAQLNKALPMVFKELCRLEKDENVEIRVRVITYNTNAAYHLGSERAGVPVREAANMYRDVRDVGGMTNFPAAMQLVVQAFSDRRNLGPNPLSPIVINITDGYSNKEEYRFDSLCAQIHNSLKRRPDSPDKVQCIGIAVGDYSMTQLEKFATKGLVGNEYRSLVFTFDDYDRLAEAIILVSLSSTSSVTETGVIQLPEIKQF